MFDLVRAMRCHEEITFLKYVPVLSTHRALCQVRRSRKEGTAWGCGGAAESKNKVPVRLVHQQGADSETGLDRKHQKRPLSQFALDREITLPLKASYGDSKQL